MALHFGLGMGWAPLYALIRRRWRTPPVPTALGSGAVMTVLVDEGLTPLLGFSAPNRNYPTASTPRKTQETRSPLMTEPANLELNKATATAALTAAARHLHLAVLTAFADTGRAPTRAELVRIAGDNGIDPSSALDELAERDVVAFDTAGEIRAAYPFSPTPTAIRVSWEGGVAVYAMCAVDALGMSAMLERPVTITAAEPGTDAVVTVHVDGDTARWTPESAVVFAGATDQCCPSVDGTCSHINFFTSADAARGWAADHPQVTGVLLDQADALACGVAEFGPLMQPATASSRRGVVSMNDSGVDAAQHEVEA